MSAAEPDARRDAEDVEMADADNSDKGDETNQSNTQTKRKKPSKHTTLAQFTMRSPTWAYMHLSLIFASPSTLQPLDALTAQLHLQAALSTFLGLHGTAIPFDFLKIKDHHVWLRLPREDASAVVAAVGGWVGNNGQAWKVNDWGCWGPRLTSQTGMDLFED